MSRDRPKLDEGELERAPVMRVLELGCSGSAGGKTSWLFGGL